MTRHYPAEHFAAEKITGDQIAIARPVPAARGEYGRTFDLPPALYAMTVGGYLAYLAVMGIAFMAPDLVIPMAIFVLFVLAAFGTPALFARMAPPPPGWPRTMSAFMREGFECMTGHVSGTGAATQVLIMPVLILIWGICIALIAAMVR
ncbi:hypothetical protein KFK14_17345 [Sphingobium phenoxybenzoativorans]|uniref:Uncharacterized protein n=1 Tax=Sphingobium phenoxybenzoativorans TaxID=1592790 RepID=A0A975K4Q9_9SPHN|nr:hypothetical protein [Sphingobium phenoxybenzoativorans]QUT04784.1 hypothetical protein KFK14_17345 [Sphingobium phenoxybenzoativorans]